MMVDFFKKISKDTYMSEFDIQTKCLLLLCSLEININGAHDDVIQSINDIWAGYTDVKKTYDRRMGVSND